MMTRVLFTLMFILSLCAIGTRAADPRFSIGISTEQSTVKSGSDISIGVVETNISNQPIWLSQILQPSHSGGIVIEVLDERGTSAPATKLYRIMKGEEVPPKVYHPAENGKAAWSEMELPLESFRSVEVEPGTSIKDHILLNRFFDLSKPDKYTILWRHFDYESKTLVQSNTIAVTITP